MKTARISYHETAGVPWFFGVDISRDFGTHRCYLWQTRKNRGSMYRRCQAQRRNPPNVLPHHFYPNDPGWQSECLLHPHRPLSRSGPANTAEEERFFYPIQLCHSANRFFAGECLRGLRADISDSFQRAGSSQQDASISGLEICSAWWEGKQQTGGNQDGTF